MEKYTMFMDWKNQYSENDKSTNSDFPGSPVVKTVCFQSRRHHLIPGWGTNFPDVVCCCQKN